MKYYFAGQTNFGNRGCEALVRSIVGLIRESDAQSSFYCPSHSIALDSAQWPEAIELGVKFTVAPTFPETMRWWARGCKVLPALEGFARPRLGSYSDCISDLERSDALIFTGGDILGLEYGVASLYHWANFAEKGMDGGKPTVLWGASVGPFNKKPAIEREMIKHLRRYAAITVRESATLEYLQTLGIENVQLVADPAFTMTPQPFDISALTFQKNSNVLGLNVSPLIRGYRGDESSKLKLDRDVVDFIKDVVDKTDMSVLLVPHVDPLDGSSVNSDSAYMKGLLEQLPGLQDRVRLAPRSLNAAQLKYLISCCRFFIGARTHATIGAFSTGVPTISIAYSVKAKGINKDLFGDTRFVLDTPMVSRSTLQDSLDLLVQEEDATRALLKDRIPVFRVNAAKAVDALLAALEQRR